MKRDVEIDFFPVGSLVCTPTGRIGRIQKSRGTESKHDHFVRLVVWFGPGPRDSVVLQPHLLQPFFFIHEYLK